MTHPAIFAGGPLDGRTLHSAMPWPADVLFVPADRDRWVYVRAQWPQPNGDPARFRFVRKIVVKAES